MIKCKNGYFQAKGTTPEIMADLTEILLGAKETFTKEWGGAVAEKLIRESIRLSFLSEAEIQKEIKEKLEKMMHG